MLNQVGSCIEWSVPLARAGATLQALGLVAVATRSQLGCCSASLWVRFSERAELRFEESWKGTRDLNDHLRSELFTSLAVLLEDALDRPIVKFILPDGTRGLEYAEEIRRQSGTDS